MTTIQVSDNATSVRRITIDELRQISAGASPGGPELLIWVDMDGPTPEEEQIILSEIFNFHHLAILDCQRERVSPKHGDHLPKVEDYGAYLFCIINPIEVTSSPAPEIEHVKHRKRKKGHDDDEPRVITEVRTRQLNTFIGANYIVTHHYEPAGEIEQVLSLCYRNPHTIRRGPDYIYHLILDNMVDRYSVLLDMFDTNIDALEDTVFRAYSPKTLPGILSTKRMLFRLRRITSYQREMVFRLARHEFELITEAEIAYYRNVLDHLVRAYELIESYRDITTSLLDAHLSMGSNRLNEIMKVLIARSL